MHPRGMGRSAPALLAAAVVLATPIASTTHTSAVSAVDADRGGGPVDRAATRYGVSAAAIRTQLAEDATLELAPTGAAYYVDPAPAATPDVPNRITAQEFPLGDTFALHSKPDSQHTVYLDFDGHTVSDSYWNASGFHPAMDLAGNGPDFTDDELLQIQDIWKRVAEDFAPFDVDVTTEEPPPADIDRADADDEVYGTRMLISPSDSALSTLCGGGCGGIAFVGIFNHYAGKGGDSSTHAQYQPGGWVFPQTLGQDVKNIAEATSHEIGHNLGLHHDGTSTQIYYPGHNGWAPIMGVGYYQPIVQFALNDYPDGQLRGFQENPDDLLTIAQFGAPQRMDEPGTSIGDAGTVPTIGYISARTDVDYFSVGACDGRLTVTAKPAPVGPNLDIELQLLDANGTLLDLDDAPSAVVNRELASGLDAEVSAEVGGGSFYVRVDGVGRGSAAEGYTDYGSVGSYTLHADCEPVNAVPEAPRIGQATPGQRGAPLTATITWQPPVARASPAIDGYEIVVYRRHNDGRYAEFARSALLAADALSAELTTSRAGTFTFAVRAHNAVGFGPLSDRSNTVRPR